MERTPESQVVAIDCDETRLKRVRENLQRLQLTAQVICGDARYPQHWWQGEQFDRIFLDAPCSATGVIRRHPEIKWLRRADDIAALAALHCEILDAMWQQLKPGGNLVYATCSIPPQENRLQVKSFPERTPDARLVGSDPAARPPNPFRRGSDGRFLLRRIIQTTLIGSTKVSHNSPWARANKENKL